MISKEEILERARALSLEPTVVEKDYVLGWMLHAIGRHPELSDTWVFKGGTCLKKIHFETYRFSEDLDFTLRDPSTEAPEILGSIFRDIAKSLYQEAGIEIPAERLRFDLYENPRGKPSVVGRVYYRGPLRLPRSAMSRVKLDLTADERLVEEPERLSIKHEYSDHPAAGMDVLCYSYIEVFAEKVRALGERGRPRDLYDVAHLFQRQDVLTDASEVLRVLLEKCAFKGIAVPTPEIIGRRRGDMSSQWNSMLAHQLPALPPFDLFWETLSAFFGWLHSTENPPRLVAYPTKGGASVLRPPIGGTVVGLAAHHLQTIRFAAACRLCVDLRYDGSVRRIEPYSLRQSRAGHVVLHANHADTGEHRSYRVDRIEGVVTTNQSFRPRWAVELSPENRQPIPRARRSGSGIRQRRSAEAVHVYECNRCGKTFRRKRRVNRTRKHTDPGGTPCGGRTSSYVKTL